MMSIMSLCVGRKSRRHTAIHFYVKHLEWWRDTEEKALQMIEISRLEVINNFQDLSSIKLPKARDNIDGNRVERTNWAASFDSPEFCHFSIHKWTRRLSQAIEKSEKSCIIFSWSNLDASASHMSRHKTRRYNESFIQFFYCH